ncbi:MAG: hypothetical protein AAGF57_12275 [Pseudomonadota bacterium]
MTLPSMFADLERFGDKWDLPDYNARYEARLTSSMDELTDFFETILNRIDAIKAYLDDIPLTEYSDEDKCLARLMFAFGVVGPAVEIFRTQRVPDSGATSFTMTLDTDIA